MISWWNFRSLLLYGIVIQLNVYYVKTAWPSSNPSNIQLLGLFPDAENASDPTDWSVHSRAMFKAAVLLSQQYNITIDGQFIGWQAAQTGGNAIEALNDACHIISTSNIVGIVGPGLSREAHVIAEFAERVGIPAISYAATDPDLSDRKAYPTFYRTVPSDGSTALAIVKLFLRYNWTSCVIIYQNDAYGSGGADVITDAFADNGLIVIDTIAFNIASLSFRDDLKTYLTNAATRIVVLWAGPAYTPSILQKALDADVLGPIFTWILSSSVSFESFNDTSRQKMIGMLTVEPVTGTVRGAPINSTLLSAAYNLWQQYEPESYPGPLKVNNYALFTFDAAWALIQSLQQLCSRTINRSFSCLSFDGSSYCFDRRFVHSDSLLKIVSQTEFLGVTGPVQFSANMTDRINGIYYYARNVQFSPSGLAFVPVLVYSDPEEWKPYAGTNIVLWPNNSLTPPTGLPSLKGVNLRICVIQSPPFTMVTYSINATGQSTLQFTGYMYSLIQLLEDQIGFTGTLVQTPENLTYDAIIQAVAEGDYDICVADVTVTSGRRETVGFSNAIFDNSLRIMMRKSSDVSYDLLAFLKPFSRKLWLLILGACIYAGLLFCIIERKDNEDLKDRSIVSQVSMSVWYSFGNIVGYGVDYRVSTAAGRLLTVGLYILSLILVASYTANLTSDLTIAKSKEVISGIDDIKSGKIPFNRIGIHVGTASEEYYLREISGGVKNYYPLYSKQDGYNKLLANVIDVSFYDSGVAQYITDNVYCNLTLVGEGFDNGEFGIVTPKNWLYAQELDVIVLALSESGALDALRTKWFEKKTCPDTAATTTALGIECMSGLFLIFAVTSSLSIILFVWTNQYELKNYLSKPVCRKKGCAKRKGSTSRRLSGTSERTTKYKVASIDSLRF